MLEDLTEGTLVAPAQLDDLGLSSGLVPERVEQVRKRHGLDRPSEAREPELWPKVSQLELFAE